MLKDFHITNHIMSRLHVGYKWIFSPGGDGGGAVWEETDAEFETSSINKTMLF